MRNFSVIVPTHNRVNYISRCLNSILDQTYKNFEIIIIDDCSIDGTSELIHTSNIRKCGRIYSIRHGIFSIFNRL